MGVGKLSRLGCGVELAADVCEPIADGDVEVDLAVAEEVGHVVGWLHWKVRNGKIEIKFFQLASSVV